MTNEDYPLKGEPGDVSPEIKFWRDRMDTVLIVGPWPQPDVKMVQIAAIDEHQFDLGNSGEEFAVRDIETLDAIIAHLTALRGVFGAAPLLVEVRALVTAIVRYLDDGGSEMIPLNNALMAVRQLLGEAGQTATVFDLVGHLHKQRAFSYKTFGPGARTAGVIDHIRKELREIEAKPSDIEEWADLLLLSLDGAWRAGFEPEQIAEAIRAKQAKNEDRKWPDWQTQDPNKAIEHTKEPAPSVTVEDVARFIDNRGQEVSDDRMAAKTVEDAERAAGALAMLDEIKQFIKGGGK